MQLERDRQPAPPAETKHRRASAPGTEPSAGMRRLAGILRSIILLSGIYQTLAGETAIGLLTLLCLAIIMAPGFFTRGLVVFFPIEIEIVLFIMVIVQYVLGEARDLYTAIPYYDKFVHAMLPGLVGFIGFLLAYAMVASGKLVATTPVIIALIVLMSLGIGAVEEIAEYSSDMLLYPRIAGWHHFQGNAQEDPWHDTMNDLIADIVGAGFGAVLGLWLIDRAKGHQSPRLPELVDEVQTMFGRRAEEKQG